MTPNKLPPLPKPSCDWSPETHVYSGADLHAYAAEVVRLSHTWPTLKVSPEDQFEQYIAAEIARSPEPLRELGEYLGRVMDEDEFKTANSLILQLATHYPAESLRQSQSLPAGAVAGLPSEWRRIADEYEALYQKDRSDSDAYARASSRRCCAYDLEEALQADAREKGEAVEKLEREVRIGRESARRAQAMYARLESLAKRWEKVAEVHGVRQFTGNDHLLFANELRTALATQPAQASEAWQPIESAPKDGAPVIVAADGDCVGEARYWESHGNWWWAGCHPTDSYDGEIRYARHWQPLPSVPSATSSQETASE